ncbi:Bug family tripartite tricarboxylate transporter substrate binding protein [Microvirga sp. M2]|uniref:Bug family tripartite tricarboxylate transporter substrate binding protein n=1 Tax=Microvirga sp. M2 TaxID=3073270 RepID=UPI0039C2429E
MPYSRRTILHTAVATVFATILSTAAIAQDKDFKILIPSGPGGGWDQTARAMQQAMTQSGVAKGVQVTNVPGAAGAIGLAQFVNNTKGDPSQLIMSGSAMVSGILTNNAPVKLDQVTPIARLMAEYLAVVVPPDSPIKTAKDLMDRVKADPAKVTWGGGAAGGIDHVAVGLFTKLAGADPAKMNYVAFSGGGEALAAILGGKVTAGISGYGEFESQIKAGKLRLIGITSASRIPEIDAPTFKEQGVDLEVLNWRSVMAAPGITPEQKKDIMTTIEAMAKSKEWQEILKQKNWADSYLPGDAFAKFLAEDQARTKEVLTSLGLVKS